MATSSIDKEFTISREKWEWFLEKSKKDKGKYVIEKNSNIKWATQEDVARLLSKISK